MLRGSGRIQEGSLDRGDAMGESSIGPRRKRKSDSSGHTLFLPRGGEKKRELPDGGMAGKRERPGIGRFLKA